MLLCSRKELGSAIEDKLCAHFGITGEKATDEQVFSACAMLIRELMSRQFASEIRQDGERHVHYLSMEFLIGRSLMKNAFNLGILDELYGALKDLGRNASDIFEAEPDAGLGNGGLGRLAACYMDSMATLGIPATGYSLCYELGIFRQKIEKGKQVEVADVWLPLGQNWLVPHFDETAEVRFGGHIEEHWDWYGTRHTDYKDYTTVLAVPRDMLIAGYGCDKVDTLRLWEAHSPQSLDMFLFSEGKYVKSLEQRTLSEVITKVLYPEDDNTEGKTLRLKQQYFFVSATAQDIVRKHREKYGDIRSFADRHVIQINDTHPSLIIPELMRIFMDEHKLGWGEAWSIVSACVNYTNHTVMAEALETWPQGIMQPLLPRIWEIIQKMNRRWREYLMQKFGGDGARCSQNLIVRDGEVRMASMCLAACGKINGVSALHGEILKKELFKDIFPIMPERFAHVTNGIDHRRWLAQINPRLHGLLCDLVGDGYMRRPEELCKLKAFESDESVLKRLEEIKAANKKDFAKWLEGESRFALDAGALLDVQVKRLHEYKRQLLCAMLIVHLQQRIRDDPPAPFAPRSFVFGAKAASGYDVAKRIIALLCSLAADVNADPLCKGKLQVHFLENYRVTAAERLMPAAQVSEQISLAGKEASGTGNMKLMMNGAVTIGTLDGANVEMFERLGGENMFLFGLKAGEAASLRSIGYDPSALYTQDSGIRRVLNRLSHGFSDGESYSDLVSRLVYGGDEYMLLADFNSYVNCHDKLYGVIKDPMRRARISLMNIAGSGIFAADRAVGEYASQIWKVNI